MRVGLNLLHALPDIGGAWSYIAHLLSALGECDDKNDYVAFVNKESVSLVPPKHNFHLMRVDLPAASRPRRVAYENSMLQLAALMHRLDCLHWFANAQAIVNTVPGVVTVYDLQAFLNHATLSLAKRLYLRCMMSLSCKRAALLLPMSHATADDLQIRLGADPARMVVIPPVVGSCFGAVPGREIAGFKSKYRLPDRFWLYVAHMYPHKNHIRLLEAYHTLKCRGSAWPVVLRGDPKGAEVQILQTVARLGLQADVTILQRIDEGELPALYSSAAAMVFPSLYEGGGIPVVEAMACGCPVAASDIPPVREFAGDAAAYFDPHNPDAIAEAMFQLQSDGLRREKGREAGMARAELFRPARVAGKLLHAYHQASRRG